MHNQNLLKSMSSGLHWLAASLICLVILLPIVWVLSVSLKPPEEWIAYPPTVIPAEPTVSNYIVLFMPGNPVGGISAMVSSAEPVTKAFINSLIVAPVATVVSVLIGFFAAYSVSRFRTGGPTLPLFVLTTRMFPPVAFAVPLLVYYRVLGLIDTRLGLILMYTAFTIAFSLWMMRGFIDGVPRHVEEAAILDGASPWRVLFTITLPLVRGGLAATGLFVFILNWTEFLFAQIFTSREAITIPVQVSHYVGAVGRFYGPMAALGVVASIPVVIAGYLIQRHLVTGFTFGLVRE
jgi:multiple sugar transport system permease protein